MLKTLFTAEDSAVPSSGTLQLRGSATMEFCAELRTAFLDALDKTDRLSVDVSQITGMDVAALQLFCSARISAIKRQKNMVLADNRSEAFLTAVQDAGFSRTHAAGCQRESCQACLWGSCGEPTGRTVVS